MQNDRCCTSVSNRYRFDVTPSHWEGKLINRVVLLPPGAVPRAAEGGAGRAAGLCRAVQPLPRRVPALLLGGAARPRPTTPHAPVSWKAQLCTDWLPRLRDSRGRE